MHIRRRQKILHQNAINSTTPRNQKKKVRRKKNQVKRVPQFSTNSHKNQRNNLTDFFIKMRFKRQNLLQKLQFCSLFSFWISIFFSFFLLVENILRERRATRTDFQAINEDLTEERMKPQKYCTAEACAYVYVCVYECYKKNTYTHTHLYIHTVLMIVLYGTVYECIYFDEESGALELTHYINFHSYERVP